MSKVEQAMAARRRVALVNQIKKDGWKRTLNEFEGKKQKEETILRILGMGIQYGQIILAKEYQNDR